MVMVDEKGVMYDIDGIPIVDTQGNMMILKLKQIKHLLENEINVWDVVLYDWLISFHISEIILICLLLIFYLFIYSYEYFIIFI